MSSTREYDERIDVEMEDGTIVVMTEGQYADYIAGWCYNDEGNEFLVDGDDGDDWDDEDDEGEE